MRELLTALVIGGTITIEEAAAIESDPIYRAGYAFSPVRIQVAELRAALDRARKQG